MKDKLEIINDKIETLQKMNCAINTLENKRYFTVCMYYEDYYPIWSSSHTKELSEFLKPLEEKVKEFYLSELKKKRDQVKRFLDQSIKILEV